MSFPDTNNDAVGSSVNVLEPGAFPGNVDPTVGLSARRTAETEPAEAIGAAAATAAALDPISRPVNVMPSADTTCVQHYHGDPATCAICRTDFGHNDRVLRLPCHHVFHVSFWDEYCVHRSEDQAQICPCCRGPGEAVATWDYQTHSPGQPSDLSLIHI